MKTLIIKIKFILILSLFSTILNANDQNTTETDFIFFEPFTTTDPISAAIATTIIGFTNIHAIKNNNNKKLKTNFEYLDEFENNIIKVDK